MTMEFMKSQSTYEEEVKSAYEVLKQVLVSPISLYTKDPDLYDKVQGVVESIEYSLFSDKE